jgi:hypothetical protein
MADLIIDDDLLQRLHEIAKKENRPVEDVLRAMVETYEDRAPDHDHSTVGAGSQPPTWLEVQPETPDHDPLDDFIGMFDDEVGNLSETVRETMKEYYQKKYGASD